MLVFAGTWEGHKLAEHFENHGYSGEFCVATEYGGEILKMGKASSSIKILEGRMMPEAMEEKLRNTAYDLIIDATHPYAVVVTENLKEACKKTSREYVRLLRRETELEGEGIVQVKDIEEAVEFLNSIDDKVLLTTGSKDLSRFAEVDNFKERLFPRILPSHESLDLALNAGIPSKNIICMQGPFSADLNIATMKQFGCKFLVSKNTGKAGGMEDKLKCIDAGYKLLIIGRPNKEEGLNLEEVIDKVDQLFKK